MFSAGSPGRARSAGRLVGYSALGGLLAAALMVPAVGGLGLVARNAVNKFMSLSTQALGDIPQRSEIFDRQGHLLAYLYNVDASYYYGAGDVKPLVADGIDRQPVSYDQISPVMRSAIVAIEDDRYYQHGAIDFKGTVRAIINDLEHKPVQGGSTIAQQYVKNVLVLTAQNSSQAAVATSETVGRKIRELRLAIAVEHQMSRNQILAAYLDDAYFGNQLYGVQVAAEAYFHTSAARLKLPQAALLAGMVENPSAYDPVLHPVTARERRNTVIARMAQLHRLSWAAADAAERQPLGLHLNWPQNGCSSASAASAAFFCAYVEQVILRDRQLGKTPQDRARLLATGGLKIYTTLDPKNQAAANNAVSYLVPANNPTWNPGGLADTEAVIQPGTGQVRAIAEDRTYGTGRGQTTLDYAVDEPYGGATGVQSGSSNKLFTLITALEQNVPFGYTMTVPYSETNNGYTNCNGAPLPSWTLNNAGQGDHGTYSLYTGTIMSINTYFANLERKVGLCNVVNTAIALGDHRADGSSLRHGERTPGGPYQYAADQLPSFTLGSINISPMTMAAAYATVASNGIYCTPVALNKIITDTGRQLPVPLARCHHALSPSIAEAVNYILQGVFNGTAQGDAVPGLPAAGKTGTGNGPLYVDFAGYTPELASYTSVFYPGLSGPEPMNGVDSEYREPGGYLYTGDTMFGANAPGQTWQMTFEHLNLPPVPFVPLSPLSALFRLGGGKSVPQHQAKHKGGGPTPSPGPTGTPVPTPTLPGPGGHHHHCKTYPFCPF